MAFRRRFMWWVAALLALSCAGPRRSRAYADDSISEHCKYHPELCVGAFGTRTKYSCRLSRERSSSCFS